MKKNALRASALVLALAAAATAQAAAPAAANPAVQRALQLLQATPAAHAASDDAFTAVDLVADADGTRHVRFTRTHRGLRVIGGDLVAHVDASGRMKAVSQSLRAPLSVDVAPAATEPAATARAVSVFAGAHDATKTELVVYARGGVQKLAYDVRVSGTRADGMPSREHVILDAHRLAVLDRFDDIQTSDTVTSGLSLYSGVVPLHSDLRNDGLYALKDATRGDHAVYDLKNRNGQFTNDPGTLYVDADNQWGDGEHSKTAQSDAVDAAYGQNMTWDFYKTVFGRNGIADDGRGGFSRVHSKTGLFWYNAFWSDDCFCMTYTSGMSDKQPALVSLDVAGHEMTHGVTSNSAGLIYSDESGGLNEGTSDIMGNMVEAFANNPNDPPDYLLGEQMGKPLRTMYHPSVDGDSADCWYPGVGNLNVHYSSGVANHVYYLMAEGSQPKKGPASPTCVAGDTKQASGNAKIEGVGRGKAQAIWYRALTVYMVSDETYAKARDSVLSATADLYGADSKTWKRVAKAWAAVNVK
jgi:Zn-dependent metalloprotease